jgi:hypothetical protein
VREEAIEDQGIHRDNSGGSENNIDAEPEDGNALLYSERVMEGVVFERKVLVERRDLVDCSEDADEETLGSLDGSLLGRWSCAPNTTQPRFSYTIIR